MTGLDVLARLKTEHLESKVIVLTMHHDADLATDAIRGGASGFLKESAGDEVLAAVRHALEGKVYITPTVTKEVMEPYGQPCEDEGTTADATTTRHPATDREGSAHEGDRYESGPVDPHGGRPPIRDDGGPRGSRLLPSLCGMPWNVG